MQGCYHNIAMYAFAVLVLLSLCIIGNGAVCPEDPKLRAAECGKKFSEFGQKADESIEVLLAHCPEVYEALDCLRDLMKDCEIFQSMGLQMPDEQYQRMKTTIDEVCRVGPAEVNVDTINKVLIEVGNLFYRIIFVTKNLPTVPGKILIDLAQPVELPVQPIEQPVQPIVQPVQSIEQPVEPQTDIQVDPPVPVDNVDGVETPSIEECKIQMNACNQLGTLFTAGQSPTEMCGLLSQLADCQDKLLADCGTMLPAETARNLGFTRQQYNTVCGARPGKRSLRTDQLCSQKSFMCASALNRGTCTSTRKFKDCINDILNSKECANIPPVGRNALQMQVDYASQLEQQLCNTGTGPSHSECLSKFQVCNTFLPENPPESASSPSCQGALETWNCYRRTFRECPHVLHRQPLVELQRHMTPILHICGAGIPGPGKRSLRTDSEMNTVSVGIGIQAEDCMAMKDKCYRIITGVSGNPDVDTICSIWEDTVQCFENTIDKCKNILPDMEDIEAQRNLFRQQINGACNTGTGPSHSECLSKFQVCNTFLPENPPESASSPSCQGTLEAWQCYRTTFMECPHVLLQQAVVELQHQMAPILNICIAGIPRPGKRSLRTGNTDTGPSHSECLSKFQVCNTFLPENPPESASSSSCQRILEAWNCYRTTFMECPYVLTQQALAELQRYMKPILHICIAGIPRPGRSMRKRSLSTECSNLAQGCLRMLSGLSMNNGLQAICHDLRGMVKCMENVISECKWTLPNIETLEKQMIAAKKQVNAACNGPTGLPGGGSLEPNTGSEMNTVSDGIGIQAEDCVAMTQTCFGYLGGFTGNPVVDTICIVLDDMVQCLDNTIDKCKNILPDMEEVEAQRNLFRQQMNGACGKGRGNAGLPGGPTSLGPIADSEMTTVSVRIGIQAEDCVAMTQTCLGYLSGFTGNPDLDTICSTLEDMVQCLENTIDKCKNILPDMEDIEAQMNQARQQTNAACGAGRGNAGLPGGSTSLEPIAECGLKAQKCLGHIASLSVDNDVQAMCGSLDKMLKCMNNTINECRDILDGMDDIENDMNTAREQYIAACSGISGADNTEVSTSFSSGKPPSNVKSQETSDKSTECATRYQNCIDVLSSLSSPQQCPDMQPFIRCIESLEGCIAIIPTSDILAISNIGVMCEQNPEDRSQNMSDVCVDEYNTCQESILNITSSTDCIEVQEKISCIRNLFSNCGGVSEITESLQATNNLPTIFTCLQNKIAPKPQTEKPITAEECGQKSQVCLQSLSTFSVKHGMEATCLGLDQMVQCMEDVVNKCGHVINIDKFDIKMKSIKEQVSSACNSKYISHQVVVQNANQQKCMEKYQKCAGLMAKVPLSAENSKMCLKLRMAMACIKKVTLECVGLLPESISSQVQNFENLNKFCPVGQMYKSKSRPIVSLKYSEKCQGLLASCDNKLKETDINSRENCRTGFKIMACYRQAAKTCRLPKARRKSIKSYKNELIRSCERKPRTRDAIGDGSFEFDNYFGDDDDDFIPWLDSDIV